MRKLNWTKSVDGKYRFNVVRKHRIGRRGLTEAIADYLASYGPEAGATYNREAVINRAVNPMPSGIDTRPFMKRAQEEFKRLFPDYPYRARNCQKKTERRK